MIGAKVNGKYVMASHQLANAEIVDILTYDGPLTRNLVARHQVCYEMLRSRVQITVALLLPFALLFPLPFPLPFPLLCPSLRFAFPFAPFPSLSLPPPAQVLVVPSCMALQHLQEVCGPQIVAHCGSICHITVFAYGVPSSIGLHSISITSTLVARYIMRMSCRASGQQSLFWVDVANVTQAHHQM